ncbi:unnamed protein product [Pedinophyceae sp. YPF-701]|nr:unnamed protein product [Pedinophyceae sp. YPF-701]
MGAPEGNEKPATVSEQEEILREALEKPARATEVVIEGNRRTQEAVILRELRGLTEAPPTTKLADLFVQASLASARLHDLGIFEWATVELDDASTAATPAGAPHPTAVRVELHERPLFHGRIQTSYAAAARETTVEATTHFINPLGRAEKIEVGLEGGLRRLAVAGDGLPYCAHAAYTDPRFLGSNWQYRLEARRAVTDWTQSSSFRHISTGLSTEFKAPMGVTLAYEIAIQTLTDPTRRASKAVRTQMGDALKSAVSAKWAGAWASHGIAWRTSLRAELAGLAPPMAGLSRYVRKEAAVEASTGLKCFIPGARLHVTARGGVLVPWGSSVGRPTPLAERFHLGGVGSLRGFNARGVGPMEPRRQPAEDAAGEGQQAAAPEATFDSVGGDVMWSLGAALRAPVPHVRADIPLQWQVFADVGSNVALPAGDDVGTLRALKESWAAARATPRSSVGAGLVLPFPGAGHLELNMSKVVGSMERDRFKQGWRFQFGLTVSV